MMWNPRVMVVLLCLFGYWSLADFLGLGLDGVPLLLARCGVAGLSAGAFWYMTEKKGW